MARRGTPVGNPPARAHPRSIAAVRKHCPKSPPPQGAAWPVAHPASPGRWSRYSPNILSRSERYWMVCRMWACQTWSTSSVNGPYTDDVDQVWHAHILHTIQYRSDRDRIFGEYLDHRPGEAG